MSGKPRLRLAAVLCAAAAALTLTGCSSTGSGSGDAQAGFVAGTGGLDTVPVAQRKAAPAIGGNDLAGKPTALADYPGKIVVINVWGSWCSPCRDEAKNLEQAYDKYKDQGVQFLGINTRDLSVTNAQRFEQVNSIGYPSIFDPDGTQILKFPKGSLNPQTIPTTLVIDRRGRLAARAMKPLTSEDVDALIAPVLAEPAS
ncbi:TlpA disulfide reductase family protein [Kitasatospora nipponensis]